MLHLRTFFLLVWVSALLAGAAVCQSPDAEFQNGKQLIESNCAECIGATKKGLQQGVSAVQRALDQGFTDKVAAYKLLADAYNTLVIVHSAPGSEEQKSYREAREQAYRRLIDLDPHNASIRYEYAMTLKDRTQQIAALREALKIEPNNANAHYALGTVLIRAHKPDEGVEELKKSLQLADSTSVVALGNKIMRVFDELGRKEDAEWARIEIEKKVKQ